MQVGSRRPRYRLSLQALRRAYVLIFRIETEGLGRAAVHVENLDIGPVCGREYHRGGADRVENLYVAGCQGLCLIRAGINLRILHRDSHIFKTVGKNSFMLLNDGRDIERGRHIGEHQFVKSRVCICRLAFLR